MKLVSQQRMRDNMAKTDKMDQPISPIKVENFETNDSTKNLSDSDEEGKAMEPSSSFGLMELLEITQKYSDPRIFLDTDESVGSDPACSQMSENERLSKKVYTNS